MQNYKILDDTKLDKAINDEFVGREFRYFCCNWAKKEKKSDQNIQKEANAEVIKSECVVHPNFTDCCADKSKYVCPFDQFQFETQAQGVKHMLKCRKFLQVNKPIYCCKYR